jgi:hypothetical protein
MAHTAHGWTTCQNTKTMFIDPEGVHKCVEASLFSLVANRKKALIGLKVKQAQLEVEVTLWRNKSNQYSQPRLHHLSLRKRQRAKFAGT